MNAPGGSGQGGMPTMQQQQAQQLFASMQALNAQQNGGGSGGIGGGSNNNNNNNNYNNNHPMNAMLNGSNMMGMGGMGGPGPGAGAPMHQQSQSNQPQSHPQQQQQTPNMNLAMQNPVQLLQVISAQIQNLQRQWQTVQQQADSPQKAEASQHLATQMKRMKFFQAQTMQALQNRQQLTQQQPGGPSSSQGPGTGQDMGVSAGNQQNTHQGQAPTPNAQQPFQAPTPQQQPQTPQQHPNPTPPEHATANPQQAMQLPQGQGAEAPSPAHNAQLAALQAFAQQQRIQAMHQHNGASPGTRQHLDGRPHTPQRFSPAQSQQQHMQYTPGPSQLQHVQQENGSGSRPSSRGTPLPQHPQQQQQLPQGKTDLLSAVRVFMAQRGTPLPPDIPTVFVGPMQNAAAGQTKMVDMQTLFATIIQLGGSTRVSALQNGWAVVASKLGLAVSPFPPTQQPGHPETDANGVPLPHFVAPRLAQFFRERFGPFEEFWISKMKGAGAAHVPNQSGQRQSLGSNQQPNQTPNQRPLNNGPFPPSNQQMHQAGMPQGNISMPQSQQYNQSFAVRPQQETPSGPQQMQHGSQGPPTPAMPQQQQQQHQQQHQMLPMNSSGHPPLGQSPMHSSVQDAMRKAMELQAALPQHFQQLQGLMSTGKITQDQAKERFSFLQNQAKTAMLQAQSQAQSQAQGGMGAPMHSSPRPPQTSQPPMLQPPRPMSAHTPEQGPGQMPQPFSGQAQQAMQPAQMSRPSSQSGMGPPLQAPHAQNQQARPQTPDDNKKAPKRSRKSTANSTKQPETPKSEYDAPSPTIADAKSQATPQASPADIAQANQHAQQAARMLHRGVLNPSQQVSAFAVIRRAQLQMQNVLGVDVIPAAQSAAQVYARILSQAKSKGQPPGAAAHGAFAAAQQEAAKVHPLPPGAQTSPSMLPGTGQPPTTQAPQQMQPPSMPQPTSPPNFKVEYMPVRRDVRTFGGWDLDFVDGHLGPVLAGWGRFPRSVRELGHVDMEGLIMSLRSRLEVEVTYALNALLILTASVQAPGFNLLLSLCEDLCDELLDLLEETAFVEEQQDDFNDEQGQSTDAVEMPAQVLGHAEWVLGLIEDESENKVFTRHIAKRGRTILDDGLEDSRRVRTDGSEDDTHVTSSNDDEYRAGLAGERDGMRKANVAMTIIDIMRNLATIPDNVKFLNDEPRFYQIIMKLAAALEHEEQARRRTRERTQISSSPHTAAERSNGSTGGNPEKSGLGENLPVATVFNASEAMRVRKDILTVLASLAKETCELDKVDDTTVRSVVRFLSSFVEDASEIESQHGTLYREALVGNPLHPEMQPVMRRVPFFSDMALEAFSSVAQPDTNRQRLGKILDDDVLVNFGATLFKLLPVSDMDFQMLKTEARLAYCERIAMSLFNLAYLGNANVKRRLKTLPGAKGIVFRCIKRLMRVNADYNRNPFSVLTRRLVETLRILSDGDDLFDRPALLGFGMASASSSGGGASKADASTASGLATGNSMRGGKGAGAQGSLLVNDEAAVVELMTLDGIDPAIVAEFEQML